MTTNQSQTADVAIIGGGIVGMSCAYELARQGAGRVVVFDKQIPGCGTTGGSAGVICLHDMGAIYATLTLLGYDRVRQLQREHGFGFRPWGELWVAYEPYDFPPQREDAYHRLLGGGEDSIYHREFLDKEELLRRYPWIKPEGVKGGVLHPNQGFIDPYELVNLYHRLATETGNVEVRHNNPVLQVRRSGERITSLVTRRGEWHVGKVLNAAGPWGAKVAELAGTSVDVVPQRIQVCVASGFDDGVEIAPLTSVPESIGGTGVWCRGELGGTLLFGEHWNTTREGCTVDPDHVNRVNDADYPSKVESAYRKYWHLPNSVFLNGWCCVYGTTADGLPIVSRDTQVENLYHALGMNGHGMTCHAGIAMCTTELILRDSTRLPLADRLGVDRHLDFTPLDAGRFARGELLDFDLREEDLPTKAPSP
jgi:sarcosine oxidase subunit beta